MKEFSIKEKAAMKRIAANVYGYLQKRNKLMDKISKLQEECNDIQKQIDINEAPLKVMTEGYTVEDIFNIITDNKPVKFEFKYETIVPVEEEHNDMNIIEEEQ